MKIVDVRCHPLVDPGYDTSATSSAQDDLLVEIETDTGLVGIGESDLNPWIGAAHILSPGTHSMGRCLAGILLGQDPLQPPERLWTLMYEGTAMNGRRGAGVHAIGALDMALWDLRGKAAGVPCHAAGELGGAVRDRVTAYASLQPDAATFEDYLTSMVEWALRAREIGFRAAKLEITLAGPYAHLGLRAGLERMVEVIAAVREAVGPDMTLLVDAQYAFPDAETCLDVIRTWTPYDVTFLETPLPSDDVRGYTELVARSPIPIAQGEWLATRHEFAELVDRRALGFAQPDIGRVGGLTEARRVVELMRHAGLPVVPHAWKTSLSIAAALHLAVTVPEEVMPFIEYLPPGLTSSPLRRELTTDLEMRDGLLLAPTAPGLGVEINAAALARFESAAAAMVRFPA